MSVRLQVPQGSISNDKPGQCARTAQTLLVDFVSERQIANVYFQIIAGLDACFGL
jgi:hypothetical protein